MKFQISNSLNRIYLHIRESRNVELAVIPSSFRVENFVPI